jgi:uncharacterized protein
MPSYAYLAVAVELKKRNNYRYHYSDQMQTSQYLHTNTFVPKQHNTTIEYLKQAIQDGLDRLLMPSLEREMRSEKKRRSDEAAIKIFGENIKQLLLTPPVRGKKDSWFWSSISYRM